ncbi:MAG TPA: NepR family anti-sigma factor [Candidatus Didemnitutus sp.]|nr:NepR family anti-sigma factor [Candidatus Didemnitutus sp.]
MKKETREKQAERPRRKRRTDAVVDSAMRATIGAQLRAMHEDIVQEGVPDRFRELLDRLDKSQGKD